MADLDAELLALAGDTSDEEEALLTSQRDPIPGAPPASSSSAPAPRKATRPRPKRPRRRDDSEDDGEATPASDAESAAMSESASASANDDEVGPLFPVEGKFYSQKDKAEVMAKNEVEREGILAERASIIEKRQQDAILKRLVSGMNPDGTKKRKAGAAALEEGERKSARQRTTLAGRKVGEASAPLEAYKQQRERKDLLDQQRRADIAAGCPSRRRDSASPESEGEADAVSDAGWGADRELDEPAELHDYQRVRIGRTHFADICLNPGFEETVKNCYIRLQLGVDPKTREPIYRMARIDGIKDVEDKLYAIEKSNRRAFTTKQHVVAAIGHTRQTIPFIYCSMGPINERDLVRYKSHATNDNEPLPKKAFLAAKSLAVGRLLHLHLDEAQLQERLKRSGVLAQKANAIERQALQVRRAEAEARGDDTTAAQIEEQLKLLAPPKLAYGTSLTPGRGAGAYSTGNHLKDPAHAVAAPTPAALPPKTQQQRLAETNRRNRIANREQVGRAQLVEQRAQLARRAAVERGEAQADPFARVKVMPKIVFDVNNPYKVPAQKLPPSAVAKDGVKGGVKGGAVNGVKKEEEEEKVEGVDMANLRVELKHATFDWADFDQFAAFSKVCRGRDGEKGAVFRRKPCVHEIMASYDFGLDDLVQPDVKPEDAAMA